jgi:hypothetical protein
MKTIKHLALATVLVTTASAHAGTVADGDLVTFSANTTAKAAEVNQNFTAIKNAVNGSASDITTLQTNVTTMQSDITAIKSDVTTLQSTVSALPSAAGVKVGTSSGSAINFTSSVTNIGTVTIPAPAAGIVVFTFSGLAAVRSHDTGTATLARCGFSTLTTSIDSVPNGYIIIPSAIPTFAASPGWGVPMNVSFAIAVGAAGDVTRSFNCQKSSGGGALDGFVQYHQLFATFYPTAY